MQINGIEVLDHIPEGWKAIRHANMAPLGYLFVSNNKSRFSKEYRHALVREEAVDRKSVV